MTLEERVRKTLADLSMALMIVESERDALQAKLDELQSKQDVGKKDDRPA